MLRQTELVGRYVAGDVESLWVLRDGSLVVECKNEGQREDMMGMTKLFDGEKSREVVEVGAGPPSEAW